MVGDNADLVFVRGSVCRPAIGLGDSGAGRGIVGFPWVANWCRWGMGYKRHALVMFAGIVHVVMGLDSRGVFEAEAAAGITKCARDRGGVHIR